MVPLHSPPSRAGVAQLTTEQEIGEMPKANGIVQRTRANLLQTTVNRAGVAQLPRKQAIMENTKVRGITQLIGADKLERKDASRSGMAQLTKEDAKRDMPMERDIAKITVCTSKQTG